MNKTVLVFFAFLLAAIPAFPEKVDGEPGAVMKLRDSKITFRPVVDVPGPRIAALQGDMFPDSKTSEWKMHFGTAPNGIDPDISGTLKTTFDKDRALACTYRLVGGKDCDLFDIFISGGFPNELMSGGRIVADGTKTDRKAHV